MNDELILNVVKNRKNGQLNIAIPKNKINFIPDNPKKAKLKILEFFE